MMDGKTFDQERDGERLSKQMKAVRAVMLDHEWHTLWSLNLVTGAPEASISARLRDLRKDKFGGYIIERQHIGNGLWQYRLLDPAPQAPRKGDPELVFDPLTESMTPIPGWKAHA